VVHVPQITEYNTNWVNILGPYCTCIRTFKFTHTKLWFTKFNLTLPSVSGLSRPPQ
jgi:hypothetical protein